MFAQTNSGCRSCHWLELATNFSRRGRFHIPCVDVRRASAQDDQDCCPGSRWWTRRFRSAGNTACPGNRWNADQRAYRRSQKSSTRHEGVSVTASGIVVGMFKVHACTCCRYGMETVRSYFTTRIMIAETETHVAFGLDGDRTGQPWRPLACSGKMRCRFGRNRGLLETFSRFSEVQGKASWIAIVCVAQAC